MNMQKAERSDWRQYIPIYGIHQLSKDFLGDKPTLISGHDGISSYRSWLYSIYQGVSMYAVGVALYYATNPVLERII